MIFDIQLYLEIVFTLFIIIDPFGYSLIFFALTKDYEKNIKNKISAFSVFYSSIILILYLFLGNILLNLIHVDIGAMKITGGLALFKTAYSIVYGEKNNYEICYVGNGVSFLKKIVKDFQISEVIHSDASSMFNLIDKAIKDKLYSSAEKISPNYLSGEDHWKKVD